MLAVVIVIDITPIFLTWARRIHIGRHTDQMKWSSLITGKGLKWLSHTPKIPVTDNTRLIFIDKLRGNYTKHNIQHWQEAALVLGLSESLKYSKVNDIENALRKFLNSKLDSKGHWKIQPEHVDIGILAYAIMKLDFIADEQYKPALDFTWQLIQEHVGEDGTVQYRKHMKAYRYVDTIGMICPFLIAYGTRYNIEACTKLAVKQIQAYAKYGMHEQLHIPCHAYATDNIAPLGLFGWGRGLGWYAIGLIDALKELPIHHQSRPVLEELSLQYAKAVMNVQQDNGSWNWTVTRTESGADSSATATLAWFLLNVSAISENPKTYLESVEKAIRYLMKATRRNGVIDFSQGDTKDIGVYSQLFDQLPFTQGFCIRTICHVLNKQEGYYLIDKETQ